MIHDLYDLPARAWIAMIDEIKIPPPVIRVTGLSYEDWLIERVVAHVVRRAPLPPPPSHRMTMLALALQQRNGR